MNSAHRVTIKLIFLVSYLLIVPHSLAGKTMDQTVDEGQGTLDIYNVTAIDKEWSSEKAEKYITLKIKQAMARLGWPVDLRTLKNPKSDLEFKVLIKQLETQVGFMADGALTKKEYEQIRLAGQLIDTVRIIPPVLKKIHLNPCSPAITPLPQSWVPTF